MRLAARTERLEGSGSGAIQVLLESADVDLDSDGCVATIEPVPTVRPVEWRGERARRLALLAFDPVAGVFILGRIDAFAVHVRSEERRVGKECVSTCRSRWSPYL